MSTLPGQATGSPFQGWRSVAPDQSASWARSSPAGSDAKTVAPRAAAVAAWAGQRATVATSTSGYSCSRMAVAVVPSAPAPWTTTRLPGSGGLRVMAWNETDHGSASTASSSGIASGTGKAMLSCSGRRSAKPPVASTALPVWMPGESRPAWKLAQME